MKTKNEKLYTHPEKIDFFHKVYWLNQLAGEFPETNIINDYLRPEFYQDKNTAIAFKLSERSSQFIINVARGSDFAIYLLLMSAFNILLHKYTDNKNAVIGIPSYQPKASNNRIKNRVLPLCLSINNKLTFKQLLLQVKEAVVNAYTHQNYSIDEIINLFKIPQTQNRSAIYDIVFLLENIHNRDCLANLKNDLTVSFLVNESGIEGKIEYSRSLFKDEAIATIIDQYLTVVESVIENLNMPVADIVICSKTEQQLLKEFNENTKAYPIDKTIHNLFLEQVAKTPNEIAVVCLQDKLTYLELNTKVNKLAALLRKLGVEKGDFVGILQARSSKFLVSILAILKVGGAYVPLDCTYPPERIKYMLTNSEATILLTQSSLLSMFADELEDYRYLKHIVCSDTDNLVEPKIANINLYSQLDIEQLAPENTEQLSKGSDRAYTIYTSGSTGLPKGAIVRHDGAINHIYAQFDALELQKGFSFLQSAPASSDISVWQFLAPILFGGRTVIADKETVCNPEKLFKLIKQEQINLVELVPVVLSSLLDYISQLPTQERLLLDLQCAIVTGEYVAVELVNRWLSLYPAIKVANAYGPTEAADDITQFIATKPLSTNLRTVPIGKPLANLNLYILDSQMQLQPIGVPGQICVSGIGVGDGYWQNKEKTNSSFVPNPFVSHKQSPSSNNQDVIYKTGDLGRWLPDGNIEFLGRIDHQVKLRGFRIELGEIEALLTQHSAVRSPVVAVREDIPGDKRLIAYIVPNLDQSQQDNISSLPTTLRNFLKEKLPEHSIPSAFVLVEALPLTPNGKVDRRALPAPDSSPRSREQPNIAPRTPVEEVIAGVWTQVLKSDRISVDDNFFEQGGHSLLATQLISRLRNVFQIELPLRYVFEFPTVTELAQAVEEMKKSKQGLQTPPIVPVARNNKLPLSFAQEGLWYIHQVSPDTTIYNSSAAIRLTGSLNISAFEQSLNEIVRRHEILRTTFTVQDEQPVQVISPNLTIKLPVVNLQDLPEAEREKEVLRLATEKVNEPFNLEQGPLLRVNLLKLSQVEHIALFTMHHILFDGWSAWVFFQELSALYLAFCAGKSSPLPELSIQYADFAYWQRQWLQGEVLDNHLSYWKRQLADAPTTLDLQKIAKAPPLTTQKEEYAAQSFLLPTDLAEKLRTFSSQEGVTLFMTLLASFQTLLYRYTDREDIVVGTDVANRNQAEIEPLIGFFINLLVLRSDLSCNPTFRELLERVRKVTLEAYEHQDLPFAKLVEVLRPDRTTSITPLFQVLFVLKNEPTPVLEVPDLTFTIIEPNTGIARFDLALFMEETERGIVGTWKYRTDLFNPNAIAQISANLQTLLSSITQNPDTQIDALEMLSESEKQAQITAKNERDRSKFTKFKNIQPKSVNLAQQVIQTSYLQPEQHLPLTIQPVGDDFDLANWASNNREFIENNLLQHGAILFRDCKTDSVLEFEKVANAICPNLFANYGDLPKAGNSEKVYSSTPYPSDRPILFHNESSHLHQYPLKIWFFCVQPAQQGGETPIVDCHKVYQLLNPQLRSQLEQKQLMYVRNYIEGLDVSWQDFFHTTDKTVVEQYCRKSGIDCQWFGNNLRTRQVRPAISHHPKTGKPLFFNQVQLHHISCLEPVVRASLLSTLGAENLPRNVYYGDGSPIEDSVMAEIGAAYIQAQISFPWQQGDILMLDNMLIAHGRNPYQGARKIVVAMGEMSLVS